MVTIHNTELINPDILMQEFMDNLHNPDMVAMRVAHFIYTEQLKMLSKHKEILKVIKNGKFN